MPDASLRKFPRILMAIFAVSLSLRLFSALYQGNEIRELPGTHDQVSYHTLAGRVLDGHGFSFGENWWPATRADRPTAHWSYLYTLYLTLVYALFGANPIAARLIQAIAVAVLHPWLCWRIGRRLFGERAGLAAAAAAAVYGYFAYYAGALMTESFYLVAILWTLERALALASGPSAGRSTTIWLQLGLAAGTAVLLRQVFLFFVPLLLGWILYASRRHGEPLGRAVRGSLAACALLALMILPWTIRNYRAFGHFVLLNTNAGFAFFWGNHPVHGTSFIPILQDEGRSYGRLIPREYRRLDEAMLDRRLLADGLSEVAQEPGRYLLLSLSRVKEYFRFWPSGDSSLAGNLIRLLSFGLFAPLMLLGIAVSWPQAASREGNLLLFGFAIFYTLMHLLSWALIRYRLPVDAVLLLYAGTAMAWLVHRLKPATSFSDSLVSSCGE